jgi:prepilin-type processing-associated H-X9-DG protein/prepilin-type N-terminal cleavage/methylation domain-containing protein
MTTWGAPNRQRAFTQIELLVVIAILAVLGAILLPILSSAREKTRCAQCSSDLRQIGIMFTLYAKDNQGRIMQRYYGTNNLGIEVGYDEMLVPYMLRAGPMTNSAMLFTCPDQSRTDYPHQPGYGMNWYYDNVLLASVKPPGGTILLAETLGTDGTGSHRADENSTAPGQLATTRHSGKYANYLFFDGHVNLYRWQETTARPDMWGTDQNAASHESTPSL